MALTPSTSLGIARGYILVIFDESTPNHISYIFLQLFEFELFIKHVRQVESKFWKICTPFWKFGNSQPRKHTPMDR